MHVESHQKAAEGHVAFHELERSRLSQQLRRLRRRLVRHPRLVSQVQAVVWRLRELNRLSDAAEGRFRPEALVVDDHLESCLLLTRFLSSLKFSTIALWTGQQAIDFLHLCQPRLVFLDLVMPDMDGFAVLEAIRARQLCRQSRVVIYSGNDEPALTERAKLLGAHAFITKGSGGIERVRRLVQDTAIAS